MSDDRDKQILADWSLHPGHQLMRKKLLALRGEYYTELGRTLYTEPAKVDTASLIAQRQFFKGALWILNDPAFTRRALERAQAQDEGETT